MARETHDSSRKQHHDQNERSRQPGASTGNQRGNQKGSGLHGEPGDNRGNTRQDETTTGHGPRGGRSEGSHR